MRPLRPFIFVITAAAIAGCSSEPATPAATSAASPDAAPATPRAGFEISDVAPAVLSISGDQVRFQTLQVSYTIPDAASVSAAELRLYVGELGDLVKQPVTPEASGVMQFSVDPRTHSLGTHVQVRASCPAGLTEWYSLGQMPYDYDTRRADVFRIASVTPTSIHWSPSNDLSTEGAGQRLKIFGPQLTPDCRIEAQANGASIELNNVLYFDRHFEGLLMNRDISFSSVSPRYAELKLVITQKSGRRLETVKRIPFDG